jgi:hypothetical protein
LRLEITAPPGRRIHNQRAAKNPQAATTVIIFKSDSAQHIPLGSDWNASIQVEGAGGTMARFGKASSRRRQYSVG